MGSNRCLFASIGSSRFGPISPRKKLLHINNAASLPVTANYRRRKKRTKLAANVDVRIDVQSRQLGGTGQPTRHFLLIQTFADALQRVGREMKQAFQVRFRLVEVLGIGLKGRTRI